MSVDQRIICSDELFLRKITLNDTEMVLEWRNSKAVKKFFIYQKNITKEQHVDWMEHKVQGGEVAQYIIVFRQQPIGSVYLQNIDRMHNKAEYGIFIGESNVCGHGIGTKVAKAMIRYAFEELWLHRVYLRVLEENKRAIKCYEKAGFHKEALLADDVYIGGEYHNIVIMAAVNAKPEHIREGVYDEAY